MSDHLGLLVVPLADGDGEYLAALEPGVGLAPAAPAPAALLAADETDYTGLMQALLPAGWAWSRDPASNLTRLLQALGVGFARVHRAIARLLAVEADPRTVEDLLPEWERAFGLPDPCVAGAETTIGERRRVLTAKVAARGGQSIAYLVALALDHGYPVTIDEFRAATCIDPCNTGSASAQSAATPRRNR